MKGWTMKKIAFLFFFLLAADTLAQGTHKVTLTWTASPDGGVVTVYRAIGTCSTSLTFTSITSGVAGTTYADSALAPGRYCYQVTTVVNGAESVPSNQAQAVILPSSPSSLTLTVQ
jgi:hypothetical protein